MHHKICIKEISFVKFIYRRIRILHSVYILISWDWEACGQYQVEDNSLSNVI